MTRIPRARAGPFKLKTPISGPLTATDSACTEPRCQVVHKVEVEDHEIPRAKAAYSESASEVNVRVT